MLKILTSICPCSLSLNPSVKIILSFVATQITCVVATRATTFKFVRNPDHKYLSLSTEYQLDGGETVELAPRGYQRLRFLLRLQIQAEAFSPAGADGGVVTSNGG